MTEPTEFLDLEDLIALAIQLLGDPPPIRDLGLLGSAVSRPQTSVFGRDAYPDLVTKAAALLQSIVNNHSLIDGNKRLGWLATAVFLEINGVDASRASNDEIYELVMWIASTNPPLGDVATELRRIVMDR